MKKKILLASIITLSLALLVAVGGSIAWLIADTGEIENVFTTSDITVDLDETKKAFQMIPGSKIEKDPTVTVTNDIPCYLFVKITESDNFDSYLAYAIEAGWNLYTDGTAGTTAINTDTLDGTYYIYREVAAGTNQSFTILAAGTYTTPDTSFKVEWSVNEVGVKPEVTKDMMASAKINAPTITFDAAAVQKDNLSLADAFKQIVWDATTPTT